MLESRDLKTDWREDDHLRRYLRLTYLPTGQSVEVSIYKSDMKNHELALKWLTEAVEQ